jgi:hypothetical protein
MRDYGIVSPKFWVGETGKRLRNNRDAQVLAVYLMTSPHSTMTGVYLMPLLYAAHETGIPFEGVSKALARLIDEGFCEYDFASETVFVLHMAAWQIGETLEASDKRVIGVRKEVERMTSSLLRQRFIEVYDARYHLNFGKPLARPFQAPSKPGSGSGTRSRTGTGEEVRSRSPATHLPGDFRLTDERKAVAILEHLDPDRTFAKFQNYWKAASGAKARKRDWDAAWQTWCLNEADHHRGNGSGKPYRRAKSPEELEALERARASR